MGYNMQIIFSVFSHSLFLLIAKAQGRDSSSRCAFSCLALLIHICQFCRLVCCDAGINNLLDVAVHDLIQFI